MRKMGALLTVLVAVVMTAPAANAATFKPTPRWNKGPHAKIVPNPHWNRSVGW